VRLCTEDCEHIKALAAPRLGPSGLALRKGDTAAGTKDIRTSSGTFLSRQQDPAGVGPGRYCPPRHPTHVEPSFLESNAVL